MSNRCLLSPSFAAEKPFLGTNLGILSHKMKEDKEASSVKLTIDRGLHHAVYMVAYVSIFSGSSFFSMGMVTRGICRE